MSKFKNEEPNLLWDDTKKMSDQRKGKTSKQQAEIPTDLVLHLRRLTQKKGGKVVIEISHLPANDPFCKDLLKKLKKKLAVGGSFKNQVIEIQGDLMDRVKNVLDQEGQKYKQVGG